MNSENISPAAGRIHYTRNRFRQGNLKNSTILLNCLISNNDIYLGEGYVGDTVTLLFYQLL